MRQAGASGQANESAVRQNGASSQASAARSPAKRPKPSQGAKLQSPPKRRQLDASRRTTRSRAAQQGAARAAGSPVRSLVSDSESDIVVHLSDDDTSSEGDPEPEPAAQPGPSLSRDDQPGTHALLAMSSWLCNIKLVIFPGSIQGAAGASILDGGTMCTIRSDNSQVCKDPSHDASSSAETSQEAAQLDSSKPLVVVVENTEAADPATLQDLILVLSQVISLKRESSLLPKCQGFARQAWQEQTLRKH